MDKDQRFRVMLVAMVLVMVVVEAAVPEVLVLMEHLQRVVMVA